MALFLLAYDLRKQRNYQALYDELNKFDSEGTRIYVVF